MSSKSARCYTQSIKNPTHTLFYDFYLAQLNGYFFHYNSLFLQEFQTKFMLTAL